MLLGSALLVVDGITSAFSFGLKQFERRAITEPPTSTVLKGPREGFVESLPVNVSMMRRKLKTPDLIFENVTVGRYSKTPISLCYLGGIADKALVEKLKNKLKSIKIADKTAYTCKIADKDAVIIISGIGKVNAALSTKLLIDNFAPSFILNFGTCGGMNNSVKILNYYAVSISHFFYKR
jgi:hypothetical protein